MLIAVVAAVLLAMTGEAFAPWDTMIGAALLAALVAFGRPRAGVGVEWVFFAAVALLCLVLTIGYPTELIVAAAASDDSGPTRVRETRDVVLLIVWLGAAAAMIGGAGLYLTGKTVAKWFE